MVGNEGFPTLIIMMGVGPEPKAVRVLLEMEGSLTTLDCPTNDRCKQE